MLGARLEMTQQQALDITNQYLRAHGFDNMPPYATAAAYETPNNECLQHLGDENIS
jgi:hypothetical protein